MDEETKKEIEEIIGNMQCSNDFKCYQSGYEALCKAKYIGIKDLLQCLQKKPMKNTHSFWRVTSLPCFDLYFNTVQIQKSLNF